MRAETWIKTLNARLLTEPNWAIKVGYLTVLIAASLALAAFLIFRVTFSFVGSMVVQTAKNFSNASIPNSTVDQLEEEDEAIVDAMPTFFDDNVVGIYHKDYDDRLTGYK